MVLFLRHALLGLQWLCAIALKLQPSQQAVVHFGRCQQSPQLGCCFECAASCTIAFRCTMVLASQACVKHCYRRTFERAAGPRLLRAPHNRSRKFALTLHT
eukprot:GHRR01035060.1.p2 GENE.GHRR01035060.1~~GHRR01035060.1.p2  ORF type:complete len:101 (-),score=2.98 GHRR01035060.1:171-473(-)